MKSSDVLRRYYRKILDIEDLAKWAELLVGEGHESEDLFFLMSKPDLHWSELPRYVEKICNEIGVCTDFSDPREAYKNVSLAEYKKGVLSGPELLFNFEEIRKKVGFPETLTWRILEDEPDGTNRSVLYSDTSKRSGKDLEAYVNEYINSTNL